MQKPATIVSFAGSGSRCHGTKVMLSATVTNTAAARQQVLGLVRRAGRDQRQREGEEGRAGEEQSSFGSSLPRGEARRIARHGPLSGGSPDF